VIDIDLDALSIQIYYISLYINEDDNCDKAAEIWVVENSNQIFST
jgi:hypothetical protein